MHDTANGKAGYDRVTRWCHWFNAILAVLAVGLALAISGRPRHGGAHELLLMLHGSVGITILAVMVFWASWRTRHPSPPLRPLLTWIEAALAHATQAALYLLFVAMPLTGYISLAASGHPVNLFGVVAIPPLVPASDRLAQVAIALHLTGEFLIFGLLTMHVAAALMHGLVRRDGIFQRMLPPGAR